MGKDVDVEVPTDYGLTFGGGLDLDLDDIRVKELPTVKLEAGVTELPKVRVDAAVTELPKIKLDAAVTQLPKIDLGADLTVNGALDLGLDDIRIREIAPVSLELGFKPTRVHLPLNYHLSIGICGWNLLSFGLCGEGMVVVEDYQPHAAEVCR